MQVYHPSWTMLCCWYCFSSAFGPHTRLPDSQSIYSRSRLLNMPRFTMAHKGADGFFRLPQSGIRSFPFVLSAVRALRGPVPPSYPPPAAASPKFKRPRPPSYPPPAELLRLKRLKAAPQTPPKKGPPSPPQTLKTPLNTPDTGRAETAVLPDAHWSDGVDDIDAFFLEMKNYTEAQEATMDVFFRDMKKFTMARRYKSGFKCAPHQHQRGRMSHSSA